MDIWDSVFAISLFANFLGVLVFIGHRIQIGILNQKLINSSTHSVKAITSVTYALTELTKTIERDENLSQRGRDEIVHLVEAFEKRVTDIIRFNRPQATNVTVNDFNGNNAQVAQGENVKQK